MNFDERMRERARREETPVPERFSQRMDQTLSELPKRPGRFAGWRRATLSAAAVLALMVALPNVSAAMADTMGGLPVLGALFRAVTFRSYEAEEGENHVSISVPQVLGEAGSQGAEAVNEQVTAYTDQLIEAFKTELHADGYFNLDVDWEIITNTENWFTLKLSTDLVMAGSDHQERYYHIDVQSGRERTLSDLFPPEFDYVEAISSELRAQMQARMEADAREVYWLEGETQLGSYYFDRIAPDQNFYFDGEGRLVIPFNKYDVGPGSTGSPRFTLESPELYAQLLYRP